nr:MAG TPA: hypothetical protein [Caudoviricetes sp.]
MDKAVFCYCIFGAVLFESKNLILIIIGVTLPLKLINMLWQS